MKKKFRVRVKEVISNISDQLHYMECKCFNAQTSMMIHGASDNNEVLSIIDTTVSKNFSGKPYKINKFNGNLYLRFKKQI